MSTRTLRQKLLLSMQVPHRLKSFIDQTYKGAYKNNYIIKDGLIFVQKNGRDDALEKYPLYRDALAFGCKNN